MSEPTDTGQEARLERVVGPVPPLRYCTGTHGMTRCQSNNDGDCDWNDCPQLRDGEPMKTGRHCPLDCGRSCDA